MDGIWAVYFSWKRLGFLDETKMRIVDDLGRLKRLNVQPMCLYKSVTYVPFSSFFDIC